MREIKFRVWDEIGNKMYHEVWIEKHKAATSSQPDTLWWTWENGASKIDGKMEFTHIMQFTGLRDKNGKQIYEGDYVVQSIDNGGDGITEEHHIDVFEGVVIYDVNGFGIQTKGCKDGEAEIPLLNTEHYFIEIEVIGNIYEHSHLLDE